MKMKTLGLAAGLLVASSAFAGITVSNGAPSGDQEFITRVKASNGNLYLDESGTQGWDAQGTTSNFKTKLAEVFSLTVNGNDVDFSILGKDLSISYTGDMIDTLSIWGKLSNKDSRIGIDSYLKIYDLELAGSSYDEELYLTKNTSGNLTFAGIASLGNNFTLTGKMDWYNENGSSTSNEDMKWQIEAYSTPVPEPSMAIAGLTALAMGLLMVRRRR